MEKMRVVLHLSEDERVCSTSSFSRFDSHTAALDYVFSMIIGGYDMDDVEVKIDSNWMVTLSHENFEATLVFDDESFLTKLEEYKARKIAEDSEEED